MPLLHGELTKQILSCFYEVHHELGTGFPESVYSRAMEVAMTQAGLIVQREVLLTVNFRDHIVGEFRADTLVNSRVILEYKTAVRAVEVAEAQLLNYLNCTDKEVGLLLKFFPKPTFKRCFLGNEQKKNRRVPFVPRPSAFQTVARRATSQDGEGSLPAGDPGLK
jgi:GxxExxY protein